jgi:hypothetical protein
MEAFGPIAIFLVALFALAIVEDLIGAILGRPITFNSGEM